MAQLNVGGGAASIMACIVGSESAIFAGSASAIPAAHRRSVSCRPSRSFFHLRFFSNAHPKRSCVLLGCRWRHLRGVVCVTHNSQVNYRWKIHKRKSAHHAALAHQTNLFQPRHRPLYDSHRQCARLRKPFPRREALASLRVAVFQYRQGYEFFRWRKVRRPNTFGNQP